MADRQYNAIDLAKLICSILVVTIHIAPFGRQENHNIMSFLNYGIQNYLSRIAVPFFFVTSGFLLFNERYSKEKIKRYLINTLKLYLMWTLIYFPLNLLRIQGDEVFRWSLFFLRDLVFVGSYGQLWYLNALIVSVGIVAIFIEKGLKPQLIMVCSFVLYSIGLFAQSYFGFIEPLRGSIIWNGLKIVQIIIVTTRNGIFEGFFFVAMGAFIARKEIRLDKKWTFFCFSISMALFFVEVVLLEYFSIIREADMFLFLCPAAFFMFCWVRQVELKGDYSLYKELRIMSSLIFYTHLWVKMIMIQILKCVYPIYEATSLLFLLTLIFSIMVSYTIMKMSRKKMFSALSILYGNFASIKHGRNKKV